ncbi:hypothetical protein DFO73_114121 [Cytobacillus oceanisediminis]|uniref:Uncharacterized protein n=1 Tax=Cytobacillus oceanisediminis TaxID=665099 RepID=A0A2V2ZLQ1_9BACI|nr:hypothetical protein [Cytobacillus oceanisediminis]PWW20828.1 hypothetical protein DFO73_114121 [Cytobacillus oceanisediminis]
MVLKDRTLALIKKSFIECFKVAEENLENIAFVQRRNRVGSLHKGLRGDASL